MVSSFAEDRAEHGKGQAISWRPCAERCNVALWTAHFLIQAFNVVGMRSISDMRLKPRVAIGILQYHPRME